MTELTVQQQKSQIYRQTNDYISYRWSGKFQCKKVRIAHTSTKLKHTRFFTMKILPFK